MAFSFSETFFLNHFDVLVRSHFISILIKYLVFADIFASNFVILVASRLKEIHHIVVSRSLSNRVNVLLFLLSLVMGF
jgi:hypothetical protein